MRVIANEHRILAQFLLVLDEEGRCIPAVEVDTESLDMVRFVRGLDEFVPGRAARLAFHPDLPDDLLVLLQTAYPAIRGIERAAPPPIEVADLGWGF